MKSSLLLTLVLIGILLSAQPLPGRYFIAIDIPESCEPGIAEIGSLLQKQLYGRFESADKYHLTLYYLGVMTASDLQRVQAALVEIGKRQRRFTVTIAGLGFFPKKIAGQGSLAGGKIAAAFFFAYAYPQILPSA